MRHDRLAEATYGLEHLRSVMTSHTSPRCAVGPYVRSMSLMPTLAVPARWYGYPFAEVDPRQSASAEARFVFAAKRGNPPRSGAGC